MSPTPSLEAWQRSSKVTIIISVDIHSLLETPFLNSSILASWLLQPLRAFVFRLKGVLLALGAHDMSSFDHFYKSTYSFSSYPSSRHPRSDWALYKDRLLLRSQQVANSPEIVPRLGVIAMNTPLEVDIVSQVVLWFSCSDNSCVVWTCQFDLCTWFSRFFEERQIVDYAHTFEVIKWRFEWLNLTLWITKTDASCIVPFTSHVDQTGVLFCLLCLVGWTLLNRARSWYCCDRTRTRWSTWTGTTRTCSSHHRKVCSSRF